MDLVKPVSNLIDETEKLLGHSPHPAIVALPIGAWAVSNICDMLGMVSEHRSYDDAARLSMGIGLIGAAGAAVTGLRDYSAIPKERPSHAVATQHALANSIAGTLFATSYVMRRKAHAQGQRPGLLCRMLGLAGGGLTLYSGWLGGKLVEEYGEAVKPVMAQQKAREQGRDDASQRKQFSPEFSLGSRH